jgi:hypothetical protein
LENLLVVLVAFQEVNLQTTCTSLVECINIRLIPLFYYSA